MIVSGQLLPGEKVHQAELAEQLNVSRIPLREALSTLQAEGVLVHKPNTGYRVARFSSDDLVEIYLMRRLLETELMRSADLSLIDVDDLARLNDLIKTIDPSENSDEYQRVNEEFHYKLFECSPLRLVREEVSRLWYMSNFYRSFYLHEAPTSLRVVEDHDRIIDAVRRRDLDALISAADEHRAGTERLVVSRLGRSRMRA
ncbi:MAG TPA: GntR family transcriptional regulator [Amycolatopsis sp.]|nr:GntR family transcriptional regulator [Amycolatopsis sp.]